MSYRMVDIDGVLATPLVHKPSAVKIADQLTDIQSAVSVAATHTAAWNVTPS